MFDHVEPPLFSVMAGLDLVMPGDDELGVIEPDRIPL
jgi:hypothetical protein